MNFEYLTQMQGEAMAAVEEIERLTDWINRSDFLHVIPRRDFYKKEVEIMPVYRGYRYQEAGELVVTKDGETLSPKPSQKLWNHSPDGFQWGYAGSGPAQLALALLFDVTGDPELSTRLHQSFKSHFVAGWREKWEISADEIKYWVDQNKKQY